MSEVKDRGPLVAAAVGIGVILLTGVLAAVGSMLPSSGTQPSVSEGGAGSEGRPVLDSAVRLSALTQVPEAAVVVDVHSPAKLLEALRANAWTQETLKQPLGRGFVGSWAGFLGTRGEDLDAGFKGSVADWMAGELLAEPFRVVWFTGRTAKQTPTVIVPKSGAKQRAAFAAIDAAAKAGTFHATCAREKDGSSLEVEISRWVIADQSVYASRSEDGRIALGRVPASVQLGMCAVLEEMRPGGSDLDVAFVPGALGREAEHLALLLGIEGTPRATFAVEGNRLVAAGLAAKGVTPGHLDVKPVSDDLLKLVPVSAPFVATLQVQLPVPLTREMLASHLAGSGDGEPKLETRQVALIWTPHGDRGVQTELALVWSRVDDKKLLDEAFTSKHLVRKQVCKHEILASSKAVLGSIERACAGKEPSLANAKPEVVAGFRTPASIAVGVDVGKLLSGLMMDAWDADGEGGPTPPEMLEAKAQLEKLPFVRLAGKADQGNLVPGGKS